MSYEEFMTTQHEHMDTAFERAMKQAMDFFAKNLAKHHFEDRKYSQAELKRLMQGEEPTPVKKEKGKAKPQPKKGKAKPQPKKGKAKRQEPDDSSEDNQPQDFPKGMTKARWDLCCDLLRTRGDDQFLNVKTTKLVTKNKNNKNSYYWRKHFCAPLTHKKMILWAARQPEVERDVPEDDGTDSQEFEELPEEQSDTPVKKRAPKKGRKQDEEDSQEELCADFTRHDLKLLRKAAAKAKKDGRYVNATSRRGVNPDTAVNKRKYVFYKRHGYAVEKTDKELQDILAIHLLGF